MSELLTPGVEVDRPQLLKLGALFACVFAACWLFRYDLQPVARGGEGTVVAGYVLDRWTGEVVILVSSTKHPVVEAAPATPPR